jgi:transposase-like protein
VARPRHVDRAVRADRARDEGAQYFHSFPIAERALEGVEAMHMLSKGQVKRVGSRNAVGRAKFVENLFGVAA